MGIDKEKREFRITRREPYSDPNCPGHKDVSARQGYYVRASDKEDAKRVFRKMVESNRERFAYISPHEALDVQDWS